MSLIPHDVIHMISRELWEYDPRYGVFKFKSFVDGMAKLFLLSKNWNEHMNKMNKFWTVNGDITLDELRKCMEVVALVCKGAFYNKGLLCDSMELSDLLYSAKIKLEMMNYFGNIPRRMLACFLYDGEYDGKSVIHVDVCGKGNLGNDLYMIKDQSDVYYKHYCYPVTVEKFCYFIYKLRMIQPLNRYSFKAIFKLVDYSVKIR